MPGRREDRCARHGDRDRATQAVGLDVGVFEEARDVVPREGQSDVIAARHPEDFFEIGGRKVDLEPPRLLAVAGQLEPELRLLVLYQRRLEHAPSDDRRQSLVVEPAVGERRCSRELLHPLLLRSLPTRRPSMALSSLASQGTRAARARRVGSKTPHLDEEEEGVEQHTEVRTGIPADELG